MIAINILVIGNGFDIAHGLPTRYEDFLSFLGNWEKGQNNHAKSNHVKNEDEYVALIKSLGNTGYAGILINRFFKEHGLPMHEYACGSQYRPQYKASDGYGDSEYLKKLCMGDIEYRYEDLIKRRYIFRPTIDDLSEYFHNSNDEVFQIRWESIRKILKA